MPEGVNTVIRNLKGWADRKRAATVALAQNWAGTLEGQMKQEQSRGRYWVNRTHAALLGLRGEASVGRDAVRIILAHGVDYGVYLELANDGKHAILKPTLTAAAPRIYKTYDRLWKEP